MAKLAGVPDAVTKRAAELLHNLEAKPSAQMSLLDAVTPSTAPNPPLTASPIMEELADLNVAQLTPLQALNKLHELQQKLT